MTDAVPVSTGVMTLEEFIRRSAQEGPFEILDGEIVQKMATVLGHGSTADNLGWAFNQHIRPMNLGRVFTESPFVLTYSPDWVRGARIPDLMFVSAERLKAYQDSDPDWQSKPLVLVPDIAVEIASPTDTFRDINRKVKLYMEDGVKLAWIIDPENKQVHIYMPTRDHPLIVSGEGVLTGGDVLPNFQLKLSELFA